MLLFIGNLRGPDLLIILAIVVLLFGATKLPELARGMGKSIRIFKSEMAEADKEDEARKPAELNAPTSESETPQAQQPESQPQQPPTA